MIDTTKERILQAALDIFSLRGYAATGTKAIAAAAGVNEVTLFRTFGSKRAVYLEVFRRFWVVPDAGVLLRDLSGEVAEDLRRIAASLVELFIGNDKIIRMSVRDIHEFPEILAELRADPDRIVALVAEHLSKVSTGTDLGAPPERVARVFVTALMGASLHFLHRSEEGEVRRFAADFVDIFLQGALRSSSGT